MENKKRSPLELTELKKKAKKMIMLDGLTQKEASKKTGISERTIGKWVAKYGWLKKRQEELYTKKNPNNLLDFMVYMNKAAPETYKQVEIIYNEYATTFR